MNKKKYYQKRKNRKRYELPNNHRKWIGFKRGEYMQLTPEQSEDLVSKIRAVLDAAFDSINIQTQHGKVYRTEEECYTMKKAYLGLLKKMEVPKSDWREFKNIGVKHFDINENDIS